MCVSVYVYGSAQINVRKVYDPALLTLRGGERYVHFPEKSVTQHLKGHLMPNGNFILLDCNSNYSQASL